MGVHDQTMDQTLRKIRTLFLWTGLKLHNQTNPSQMFLYFNLVWLRSAMTATTYFVITSITSGSNIVELLFVAPCLAFTVLADMKAICYKNKLLEMHQLIDDLIKLEKRDPINMEIANQIKDTEINFLNKVIHVFMVLTGLVIFLFNVGPLPLIALTYYATGEVKLFLPFQDIYPFDAFTIYIWPFAYIHQIGAVFLSLFFASSTDCILFVCCTYLRIQFLMIQEDIKILVSVQSFSRSSRGDIQTKLRELLNRHQEAIRLSRALENFFSRVFLLYFMTSSIFICLTGFNVMIVEDFTLELTFIIFLLMGLSQVWCLCYFGERLMNSSEEVSDAVYESQWYEASKDISMQLLFLQLRAQKPCKLTALEFADVNLNAFMKILSRAWSYFALLNTIYGR